MANLQVTGIIRNRGQLTIPEEIRSTISWTKPKAVVKISVKKPNLITITPHNLKSDLDWDSLWNSINYVRGFRGKRGNLSEFIVKDRETH
jgi:bifunctional DNA-binding transcriptional regulator/antitoxin component of YhaV-PrlF toxin-antitoxin module